MSRRTIQSLSRKSPWGHYLPKKPLGPSVQLIAVPFLPWQWKPLSWLFFSTVGLFLKRFLSEDLSLTWRKRTFAKKFHGGGGGGGRAEQGNQKKQLHLLENSPGSWIEKVTLHLFRRRLLCSCRDFPYSSMKQR